ncbi:MAG: SagB/ThcOx family dehydrogenase [Bacteroidales bacterium]|nr:SagB/ThcOx family dehydrogenase [Bacteroidales bacterium]
MKTNFLIMTIAVSALLCAAQPLSAQKKQANKTKKETMIKLNEPNFENTVTLMDALKNRQTNRSFSSQELSWQQLSDILWAANGVNRPDNGKRTAPSARNAQEIDIYAFTSSGVFFYDAENHQLKRISDKDSRQGVYDRGDFHKAPLILVYVGNFDKMQGFDEDARNFYSATDVGFVSQNVYLYCATQGLSTVICGSFNREGADKVLQIKNGKLLLAQPVGYPEK